VRQIRAVVGGIAPGEVPVTIMVARGTGAFFDVDISLPGTHFPVNGWRWIFDGQPPAVFANPAIGQALKLFPTFNTTCNPTINGELVNGRLCLTLDKDCPAGTKLEIYARACDHTTNPHYGVDGYIPGLEFTESKSRIQCAECICEAIKALYAQANPSVPINCDISLNQRDEPKMTLYYPDRLITWGRFSVKFPQIEIEINETPATDDDYVTWSPTFCRARIVGMTSAGPGVNVVLTNDDPTSIPTGGDVVFGPSPPVPATPLTLSSLSLFLPSNGNWVPFAIAGKFGKPSTDDKDTVIEVHQGSANGPVCCGHGLMVRVRKNANNLTPREMKRYCDAVLGLHAAGGYKVFQDIHAIGAGQAHGMSAFLPWHRALVLEYERALQSIDPSVAAHYWKFDEAAPNVFNMNFMGTNMAGQVKDGHFKDWNIDGLMPIGVRSGWQHAADPSVVFGISKDATVLMPSTFNVFKTLEGDPHGSAHVWVGGWLGSIDTAVRNPVFFLLHSNVDRLWAKWQGNAHHGMTVNEYDVQGTFVCGVSTQIQGAHVNDTMCPLEWIHWTRTVSVGRIRRPSRLGTWRHADATGGTWLQTWTSSHSETCGCHRLPWTT
jgi:tyrosinase